MKVFTLVLCLFLSTVFVHVDAEDEKENSTVICKTVSELAVTIMENRQNGVSLISMMEATTENPAAGLAREMIKLAYNRPRYSSPEYQQRAVETFRDGVKISN